MLEKCIAENFDNVFIDTIDNQSITYGQFYANAKSIASEWGNNGIKAGDRIAFIANNSLSLLACYLACAIGGYTAVPIVSTLKMENIDLILSQTNPVLILDKLPLLNLDQKLDKKTEIKIETDPNTIFCIMFSSGTTGTPKSICLSLGCMIGSAITFGKLSGYNRKTRLYHILPMVYMAGLMNAFLAPFLSGSRIIEGPEFTLGRVLNFWERPVNMKVNAIVLFPIIASVLCRLARDKKLAKRNAKNIEIFQCTGNVLHKNLRKRFLDIFNKPLQDCYGITELGGGLSMQTSYDAMSEHNSGRLIPELECRLINHSAGNKELWARSPYMMKGYLENNIIKLSVDDNGYFNTGDFVEIVDGKLEITGRSKDIIIRGSTNISPLIIENAINMIEGVEDVCVIGIPNEFWGELVVACVVLSENISDSNFIRRINDHISIVLPSEYLPNKIVAVDKFPKSISGTIQKKLLLETILK